MGKKRKKEEKSIDILSSKYLDSDEFKQLRLLYHNLKKKYKVMGADVINALEQGEVMVPCSVFNKKLSTLESICKYLKENLGYEFKDIARWMGRSSKTVWQAYNSAKKKYPKMFVVEESRHYVPVSVLAKRKWSVLENVVSYLKDNFDLSFHEIGVLLQRDDRTVWTVYKRAKAK